MRFRKGLLLTGRQASMATGDSDFFNWLRILIALKAHCSTQTLSL